MSSQDYLIAGGGAVLAPAALSWLTGSLTLGFALTCALAVTMIATMLLGKPPGQERAGEHCRCQMQQPHATVNHRQPSRKSDSSGTMGQALQPAPGKRDPYERRRPEETTFYQLVQEHLETFFAQVELETGAGLPDFVKEEFDAFLQCGILAHGFLRLRCADCAHGKVVAFSCKRRGFCAACGARRMAETAAHLVDCVIPRVPVRQRVLSFPIPLRCLFAAQLSCSRPSCRSSTGSFRAF